MGFCTYYAILFLESINRQMEFRCSQDVLLPTWGSHWQNNCKTTPVYLLLYPASLSFVASTKSLNNPIIFPILWGLVIKNTGDCLQPKNIIKGPTHRSLPDLDSSPPKKMIPHGRGHKTLTAKSWSTKKQVINLMRSTENRRLQKE